MYDALGLEVLEIILFVDMCATIIWAISTVSSIIMYF